MWSHVTGSDCTKWKVEKLSLCYKNRAEITVFLNRNPIQSGMVFVSAHRVIRYSVDTDSVAEPSCFLSRYVVGVPFFLFWSHFGIMLVKNSEFCRVYARKKYVVNSFLLVRLIFYVVYWKESSFHTLVNYLYSALRRTVALHLITKTIHQAQQLKTLQLRKLSPQCSFFSSCHVHERIHRLRGLFTSQIWGRLWRHYSIV